MHTAGTCGFDIIRQSQLYDCYCLFSSFWCIKGARMIQVNELSFSVAISESQEKS